MSWIQLLSNRRLCYKYVYFTITIYHIILPPKAMAQSHTDYFSWNYPRLPSMIIQSSIEVTLKRVYKNNHNSLCSNHQTIQLQEVQKENHDTSIFKRKTREMMIHYLHKVLQKCKRTKSTVSRFICISIPLFYTHEPR